MKTKSLWSLVCVGVLAVGVVAFSPSSLQGQGGATPPAGEGKPAAPAAPAQPAAPAAKAAPGSVAPDFTLTDLDGRKIKLSELVKAAGTKAVVIEWFNPECPFVVKHHQKNPTFANLTKEFGDKGVTFIAINSGASGKQGYGKDKNIAAKKDFKMTYPVLLDESGDVGRLYGAKTTPHMFIVTPDGKIAYNGAIDNNRSAGQAGDVNYVAKALREILAGKPVSEAQTQPYGCSVKY